jgi:transposase
MSAKQWVAYAGLDPRQFESGSSVAKKPRISKAGNKFVRRALHGCEDVVISAVPYLALGGKQTDRQTFQVLKTWKV